MQTLNNSTMHTIINGLSGLLCAALLKRAAEEQKVETTNQQRDAQYQLINGLRAIRTQFEDLMTGNAKTYEPIPIPPVDKPVVNIIDKVRQVEDLFDKVHAIHKKDFKYKDILWDSIPTGVQRQIYAQALDELKL